MMLDATLQPEGVDEVSVEIDEIETEDNLQNQEYETIASANTALESYIDILKTSDGLTRQSAAILNVGLNNCFKILGLKQESTGLENYVSCNSLDARTQATVSIESLLEKAKAGAQKLWELIIKALKRSWEWASSFFDKTEKVIKFAEQMKERVKKSKDFPVGTRPEYHLSGVESHRLASSINMSSKTLKSEATTPAFKKVSFLLTEYPKILKKTTPTTSNLEKVMEDAIATFEDSRRMFDGLLESIVVDNNFKLDLATEGDFGLVFTKLDDTEAPKESVKLQRRGNSEIINDLDACIMVLKLVRDVNKIITETTKKFLSVLESPQGDVEEEAIQRGAEAIKAQLNTNINNPEIKKFFTAYVAYIGYKLKAINVEQWVTHKDGETEPVTEE